jgi:hypothetical protein
MVIENRVSVKSGLNEQVKDYLGSLHYRKRNFQLALLRLQ